MIDEAAIRERYLLLKGTLDERARRLWGAAEVKSAGLVHGIFGSDESKVTLRLNGIRKIGRGDVFPLSVEPRNLHLFDPESGARLAD